MTTNEEIGTPADQWYYMQAGQRTGPVTREQLRAMVQAGTIDRGQPVWTQAVADWVLAGTVDDLLGPPTPGAPATIPLVYATPPQDGLARTMRNARASCIALFVLLALSLAFPAFCVVMSLAGKTPRAVGAAGDLGTAFTVAVILGACGICGALYAIIYLPLRWRVIMSLPLGVRVLGLIGGFGLSALLIAMIVWIAVGP